MTRVIALSTVVLLAAGCGRGFRAGVVTARIPHPARAGLVSPATRIEFRDERAERRAGVGPNTLVDRVALTQVTPTGICAQVALWATHDDLHRGDFARYVFELEATDGVAPPRRVPAAQIQPAGQWDTSELGQRWRQVPNGLRDECVDRDMDGYCEAWETRVTTRSVREQAAIGIRYYAANVCFSGIVTEQTTELALVMSYRRRARRFVWQLDPNGSYTAPPSAQAGLVVGPGPQPAAPGAWNPAPPTAGGFTLPSSEGALSAFADPIETIPGGHPIDEAWLRSLLDARFGELRMCLERAAEADPRVLAMEGQVRAHFTVGPSGVANVSVVHSDFPPPVTACMQVHLESLPVPADPMRWTTMFEYVVGTERATPSVATVL